MRKIPNNTIMNLLLNFQFCSKDFKCFIEFNFVNILLVDYKLIKIKIVSAYSHVQLTTNNAISRWHFSHPTLFFVETIFRRNASIFIPSSSTWYIKFVSGYREHFFGFPKRAMTRKQNCVSLIQTLLQPMGREKERK